MHWKDQNYQPYCIEKAIERIAKYYQNTFKLSPLNGGNIGAEQPLEMNHTLLVEHKSTF